MEKQGVHCGILRRSSVFLPICRDTNLSEKGCVEGTNGQNATSVARARRMRQKVPGVAIPGEVWLLDVLERKGMSSPPVAHGRVPPSESLFGEEERGRV